MYECECGHTGNDHASTEPRVCRKVDCNCYLYKAYNPFQPFLDKIDKAKLEFKTWYERMFWLCDNMPFLFALNNTEIVFFYWRYCYPKWDPETEFMTPEIKKAIRGDAKPWSIERGFRKVKEAHPELLKAYQNLRIWQGWTEAGYHEMAVELKGDEMLTSWG